MWITAPVHWKEDRKTEVNLKLAGMWLTQLLNNFQKNKFVTVIDVVLKMIYLNSSKFIKLILKRISHNTYFSRIPRINATILSAEYWD